MHFAFVSRMALKEFTCLELGTRGGMRDSVHPAYLTVKSMPQRGSPNMACGKHVLFYPLEFTPNTREHHKNKDHFTTITNLRMIRQVYGDTCTAHLNKNLSMSFSMPWVQFENVLLLVVFNNPHYESIPYIETMYRPFFPYILFCGPGIPDFNLPNTRRVKNFHFSFYSYKGTKAGFAKGAFNYECMEAAIKMQFAVEGILFLADDVLVSIHHLTGLNLSHAWYLPGSEVKTADVARKKSCSHGICDKKYDWPWWTKFTEKALHLLKRMEHESSISTIGKCYRQLMVKTGGPNRLNGMLADIYYIPRKLISDFVTLSQLFLEEEIWLEIAVPSIIQCLEGFETTQVLTGHRVWDHTRLFPWLSFIREKFQKKAFLHPTKWGKVAKGNPQFRDFYCKKVLPWMHDRYGRIFK